MKPIQELNPQFLMDAMICQCSCPEHQGYCFLDIRQEIARRLEDSYTESLRKRIEDLILLRSAILNENHR